MREREAELHQAAGAPPLVNGHRRLGRARTPRRPARRPSGRWSLIEGPLDGRHERGRRPVSAPAKECSCRRDGQVGARDEGRRCPTCCPYFEEEKRLGQAAGRPAPTTGKVLLATVKGGQVHESARHSSDVSSASATRLQRVDRPRRWIVADRTRCLKAAKEHEVDADRSSPGLLITPSLDEMVNVRQGEAAFRVRLPLADRGRTTSKIFTPAVKIAPSYEQRVVLRPRRSRAGRREWASSCPRRIGRLAKRGRPE